jgi:hypothetical protein
VSREWSYTVAGVELRIMRLPDRNNLYLVLVDDDGMHCVARTLGDREATALAGFLDSITSPQSEFAPGPPTGPPAGYLEQAKARRRAAEARESP